MSREQLLAVMEILNPGEVEDEDKTGEVFGFECLEISESLYPSGTVRLELGVTDDEDREQDPVDRTTHFYIAPDGELLSAYEV